MASLAPLDYEITCALTHLRLARANAEHSPNAANLTRVGVAERRLNLLLDQRLRLTQAPVPA